MSSLPVNINYGSPASFRSALESYRRSRYLMANLIEEPQCDSPPSRRSDPEACITPDTLSDDASTRSSSRSLSPAGSFMDNLQWDGDDTITPTQNLNSYQWNAPVVAPTRLPAPGVPQERTPLIRKANSLSIPTTKKGYGSTEGKQKSRTRTKPPSKIRPLEPIQKAREVGPVKLPPVGRSTFGQTLFNAIATLLGVGMLSEPLAFAYAGWGCGTILLISYAWLTCYTAKILVRFMTADPTIRTYADIGRKAFGRRATPFISLLFCLELFTVTVALVTLYGDSLETIAPAYPSNFYKILGLIVLIPAVFLPLSWLSVASMLGIFSSVLLIAVILIDGFSKKTAPGSIWDPQPTNLGIASLPKLGVSFGLFMAGFSGHIAVPSLARDMVDPTQFDKMINTAYFIATALYGIIGAAGYCMFGNGVSEEFSEDLFSTPGYNKLLNKIALYALIITPLTKFGLCAYPMSSILDHMLGLDPHSNHHKHGADDQLQCQTVFKRVGSMIQRTLTTLLSVAVSMAFPEFSSMVGILGAVFSFLLCVIGPICAKIVLERNCTKWDVLVLLIGVAMGSWGTFSVWYTQ